MNIPEGWKLVLQKMHESQVKHYGQVAACAAAGSRLHAGEADMTEGVIKGIEDCIEALDALAAAPTPPEREGDLHPATVDLVRRFADALGQKLAIAEKKYGHSDGWASPEWMEECRAKLLEHVTKGDPLDVAAYCAFLWHHGEGTEPPAQEEEPTLVSYGLNMETCTLRFKEVEYGYDLHYSNGVSIQPAPEVEPVAWVNSADLIIAKLDREKYGKSNSDRYVWQGIEGSRFDTPLYTHPTNDGLRKVAEEAYVLLLDIDQQMNLNADCKKIMANLRAELEKKS